MTEIENVSRLLRQNKLKICCAESFTGGGIASEFVSLQGASDIFSSSLVCYSNEAKIKLLGVNKSTIESFGAVSSQTVSEMLDGLKRLKLGDVFVATSGNAGPTAEKNDEVGVFFIGALYKDAKIIKRFRLQGDRKQVIDYGKAQALELIDEIINSSNRGKN